MPLSKFILSVIVREASKVRDWLLRKDSKSKVPRSFHFFIASQSSGRSGLLSKIFLSFRLLVID